MNFKIKNITASPLYFEIFQDGATNSYIPAGATVDLETDGNATKKEIFEYLPDIQSMVVFEKVILNVLGVDLSKQNSLDAISNIYNSLLNATFTLQWTESGRLQDKNYLHNGVLEGGPHNGFILPYDCEPVEVSWSVDTDNHQAGDFVFHNNSDNSATLGTVSIPDDGHGVEVTGTDFTAFTCPKDKRIGIQWQGSKTDNVTINVTFREV